MAVYHHSLIAKEGWTLLVVLFVVSVLTSFFYFLLAIPLWLFFLFVLFVFRDPHRVIPAKPLAIVSPVQGLVSSVDTFHDTFLNRDSIKITIKMRWYDVFSLRSPMEGQIKQSWLYDEQSKNNKVVFWIQSDEQDDVVCTISGGFLWWKPDCKVNMGERVGQGQRCGFMRFGTVVEVLLPTSTHIVVVKGDRITSGETIIANLIHN